MKTHLHVIGCIILAAVAFLSSFETRAQDAPPQGGFKNPYLTVNKSGKVTLSYSRWGEQVGKGSYTLVVLWTPGDTEEPDGTSFVQAVYQKYRGKGLSVLGVPIGDELDLTMSEMTARGITYPQLVDVDEDPSGRFDYDVLPYVVLLDPKGKTVAEGLREEGIEAAVREHLP